MDHRQKTPAKYQSLQHEQQQGEAREEQEEKEEAKVFGRRISQRVKETSAVEFVGLRQHFKRRRKNTRL